MRSSPRHELLAQTFRCLKTQVFRPLGQALYDRWKANPGGAKRTKPFHVLAFQGYCSRQILLKGEALLQAVGEEGRDPAGVVTEVGREVRDWLRQFDGTLLSDQLDEMLQGALVKGVQFVSAMLAATPRGGFIFPEKGDSFEVARHEAFYGNPTDARARVKLTLFPGYLICAGVAVVVEKALVLTRHPSL